MKYFIAQIPLREVISVADNNLSSKILPLKEIATRFDLTWKLITHYTLTITIFFVSDNKIFCIETKQCDVI